MKMQTAKILTGLAAVIATGLAAQAQYTYTTLDDPLGANGTYPQGISGTNIVGYYLDTSNTAHGFFNDGITWTTLDDPMVNHVPGGLGTYAEGISETNILGYYWGGRGYIGYYDGFLYDGSTWTALSDPQIPYPDTFALGICDTNIVGYYVGGNFHYDGFLYDGSTWTTLDNPLASTNGVFGTVVNGISGTNVVGYYQDTNNLGHGFLYDGSIWTTLDDPMAPTGTWARGIDGTNIVGTYGDTNNVNHGFIYNGSTWTTLDDPLGVNGTYPQGISGANIVGYYTDSNNVAHGFLATPIPQLTITPSGNALKVSWPSWASSYVLQQNFDLAPTNWVNAPELPTLNASNRQYEVTLNPLFFLQNPHYNFRLKQQ